MSAKIKVIDSANLLHPPGFLVKTLKSILSLFKGMVITMNYLIHPSKVVTRQYPENRATLKFTPRYRGRLVMPHDAAGEHNCTGCTLCEKACPNGCINVLLKTSVTGKKVLGKYVYRLEQCLMCGLCIEACPCAAIAMNHDYELSDSSREKFVMVLNQKEGRG